MLGGLGPPVAVFLFGWVGSVAILLFLLTYIVLGGLFNLRGVRLPVIAGLIENTQRDDERFPLTAVEFLGSILVIGSLLHEFWFFPAIAVLAFGDGAAGLVGVHFGRHKLPWNRKKSWEGLGAGAVTAATGACLLTILGEEMHGERYEAAPVLRAHWIPPSVFIVVAFLAIVGGTAYVARRRTMVTVVAPIGFTVLAAAAGFVVAAIPLVLHALGWIENGPLLPIDSVAIVVVPGFLLYSTVAAVVVMGLETVLRRHDNVALPFTFLFLALLVGYFDPLGFGQIAST